MKPIRQEGTPVRAGLTSDETQEPLGARVPSANKRIERFQMTIDNLMGDIAELTIRELTALARAERAEKERDWLASCLVTAKVRWPFQVPAHGLPNRAEEVWLRAAREATQ